MKKKCTDPLMPPCTPSSRSASRMRRRPRFSSIAPRARRQSSFGSRRIGGSRVLASATANRTGSEKMISQPIPSARRRMPPSGHR